jgi:hypothetical protein
MSSSQTPKKKRRRYRLQDLIGIFRRNKKGKLVEISKREEVPDFNDNRIRGEDDTTAKYRSLDNEAAQRRFEEERSQNQDSERR